jgi:hypothetical protein
MKCLFLKKIRLVTKYTTYQDPIGTIVIVMLSICMCVYEQQTTAKAVIKSLKNLTTIQLIFSNSQK